MTYSLSSVPHLNLTDVSNQGITSPDTEQVITFNQAPIGNGIGVEEVSGQQSRIRFKEAGRYLVTFSAITELTSGNNQSMQIWLKKNGGNVSNSNTIIGLPSSGYPILMTVTFIEIFSANDYLELYMASTSSNARLTATLANSGPPNVPSSPSIILTINKVSS